MPGDAWALAENVTRLLRDSELASRLALNAREEVQRYSWGAVRQQWLEIYRSLQYGTAEISKESLIRDQTDAEDLVASDRAHTESWDSPSRQTRNQSSKFNRRQIRSE